MTADRNPREPQPGAVRLARLESSMRTYKMLAMAGVVLAIAALGISVWVFGKTRVVAGSFALAGPDGIIKAELGISEAGRAGLFLYDDERNTRIWLGMDQDDAPRVVLGDSQGQQRASLFLDHTHQQQARLSMMDAGGVARTTLGLADNGSPLLEFANDQGQPVYRVPPSAGNTPEERWVNFNTAASRAFIRGNLGEAEKLYLGALQQTRQFEPTDLRRAATLNNLGVLYLKAERLEQAGKAYDAALRIREQVLGKEHPQYAQSLSNLALLRKAQNQLQEAESLFSDSVAILEKALGKEDPRLANTLANYAQVLRGLDKQQQAADLEQRVEVMKKQIEARRKAAQDNSARNPQ